ncbi:MAG: DUF1883 domain-containing protein [Armatimonadetes bacterium]|nr:DUF1883 domain-containing protein [Armatimonadota bacterium]
MEHILYEVDAISGNVVQVTLDRQANVQLMDSINYNNYRRGGRYTYYGGRALRSPVSIPVPHSGHWYVVIDLGGNSGTLRTSVCVLS